MLIAHDEALRLKTKIVTLRPFGADDVDNVYQQWLLDPQVNRYLEVRLKDRSMPALREFADAAIGLDDVLRESGNVDADACPSGFGGQGTCEEMFAAALPAGLRHAVDASASADDRP